MTQDMLIEQNLELTISTMTKTDSLNFFRIFLVIDLGFVVFGILEQNHLFVLNSQVAFFGSLCVVIGSFFGYKKNIENRVTDEPLEDIEDKDVIDKIEDPFDLDDESLNNKEFNDEQIKNILKEERKSQSAKTFKNLIFSFGGFASLYRLIGYFVLLVGFFILLNNSLFDPISYLLGLLIVPIGALIFGFIRKL